MFKKNTGTLKKKGRSEIDLFYLLLLKCCNIGKLLQHWSNIAIRNEILKLDFCRS